MAWARSCRVLLSPDTQVGRIREDCTNKHTLNADDLTRGFGFRNVLRKQLKPMLQWLLVSGQINHDNFGHRWQCFVPVDSFSSDERMVECLSTPLNDVGASVQLRSKAVGAA